MAKVEVWKCDNCGKILEEPRLVYTLNMKSLPYNVHDGHRWEEERDSLTLHFCNACVRRVVDSLESIAKRLEVLEKIKRNEEVNG